MTLTRETFVYNWAHSELREQQAAQSHFNQLCQLAGHPSPTESDLHGSEFTFEKQVVKSTGTPGRADVWYKGKFAWEYKGKHKNLDDAYSQLFSYKTDLDNPPLLVVCDFLEYRIYPQWVNMSGQPFIFTNQDLLDDEKWRYILWLLNDPDAFRRELERRLKIREDITAKQTEKFAELAELMREAKDDQGKPLWSEMQIARFLTRMVFVLFAEDIGLLPTIGEQKLSRYLFEHTRNRPGAFAASLRQLFRAMRGDEADPYIAGNYIPYFNGGLFEDSDSPDDGIEVLDLTRREVPNAAKILADASAQDWSEINPTIFGTLFERALDPSKRAQLGAHYTSEKDIRLIVEPVLMEPLNREWEAISQEVGELFPIALNKELSAKARAVARKRLTFLYTTMIDRLRTISVLDPACGSGNFLYVSLRALKDLEEKVRRTFASFGVPLYDLDIFTPRQFYGIEKNEFAARLAQIVIWIGYLQWRHDHAGVLIPVETVATTPQQLREPLLDDGHVFGEPYNIQNDDAIMRYDAEGKPYEPEWPKATVIVGNPPFLGGKRVRTELGNEYLDQLFALYEGRVPHEADLVTYWFEKARASIEQGRTKRAGLLATNSIRQTVNREVLDHIQQTGNIFMAWSDREWILEGANVRISIIGFDDGTQKGYILDGVPVTHINADLRNTIDASKAHRLVENLGLSFMADTKGGAFDIPGDLARKMLAAINPSGRSNSDVIRPWVNGLDITRRPRDMWIIDFGLDMPLENAQLYELPFQYIQEHVYPERQANRRESYKERWWIHVEARPSMRQALAKLNRYIATVIVAKYRLFVWLSSDILSDHRLYVFARQDDYFWGVLHSYLHESWSLRLGSTLEDRPSYVGERCFETFPLPYPPRAEPKDSPLYQVISAAAKQLNDEREAWLNPAEYVNIFDEPDMKALADRTLTNLYNALEAYRIKKANGGNGIEKNNPAAKFAPRLAELHEALDAAVLRAYGWDDLIGAIRSAEGEEEVLRRLLVLNLERAGQS